MEKYTMKPKSLALLAILQILREKTDENHHLRQVDIAHYLKEEFGIEMERKAIGRHLEALEEADYELMRSYDGVWLLNPSGFMDAELRLLIESVMASRHINSTHSKDLAGRLAGLSSEYFESRMDNVYKTGEQNKTESPNLFYNIERVDEAIVKGCKISYVYNKYGVDGRLHTSHSYTVSPYQMILHNQRYYLMAYHDTWNDVSFQRLDHMTNMTLLEDQPAREMRTVKGYESGTVDFLFTNTARPYLYADEPQRIEMIVKEKVVDQVVDWFGKTAKMKEQADGRVLVTLKASPKAMRHWAEQFLNYVEVLSPKSLRDEIRDDLAAALERYKK